MRSWLRPAVGRRTTRITRTSRSHGCPAWTSGWKGSTEGSVPERSRTRPGCGYRSDSSRFRAPSPVTWPPGRRAPSIHDGVNWVTRPPAPMARPWRSRKVVVTCVAGDRDRPAGGGLALRQFLDPARDGAMLPVLHLNGTRSPIPRSFGAWSARSRSACSSGTATTNPIPWRDRSPPAMHRLTAETLDIVTARIRAVREGARAARGTTSLPAHDRHAYGRRLDRTASL